MPTFSRKKSKTSKKVELKLHIAQESREPVYDLSECELEKLPKCVEAQIKYFNKSVLILHSNFLQNLCTAAKAADLAHLTHLDLHSNRFQHFPSEISLMSLLQVLDLSYNEIKIVPDSINGLSSIRELNLKENRIHHLSSKIGDLQTLENLDLDGNPLDRLPMEMGRLKRLKQLALPQSSLTFPPQAICNAGIPEVLSYLRKAGNISVDEHALVEPSVSKEHAYEISSSERLDQSFGDCGIFRRSDLHQQMEEESNVHAELAKRAVESRVSSVKKLAQEEYALKCQLERLQKQRDEKRNELVSSLCDTLNHADCLIKFLRNRQRVNLEDSGLLSLNDLPHVMLSDENRRKVLESMNAMLAASESAFVRNRDLKKNHLVVANSDQDDINPAIQHVLDSHQANQVRLASQIAIEESEQIKAFAHLQQQNDHNRRRIVDDIHLVEAELSSLTMAERERKARHGASATADLSERRKDLVRLLAELQKQKRVRESELHERLMEMEKQKTRDQTDFWLVQYQRLIDRKPALLNEESLLSNGVLEILSSVGAEDFLSNFQYHRITLDLLPTLTNEDLIRIGVTAVGVRKAILAAIAAHCSFQKSSILEPSAPSKMSVEMASNEDKAGASEPSSPKVEPSAPPVDIRARFEAECCICQDAQCSAVFLPCGHVCCCGICSVKVDLCPLCRASVQQRVQFS